MAEPRIDLVIPRMGKAIYLMDADRATFKILRWKHGETTEKDTEKGND